MYGADTKNTDLKGYVLFALARKLQRPRYEAYMYLGLGYGLSGVTESLVGRLICDCVEHAVFLFKSSCV
jgi:hypothetical protein